MRLTSTTRSTKWRRRQAYILGDCISPGHLRTRKRPSQLPSKRTESEYFCSRAEAFGILPHELRDFLRTRESTMPFLLSPSIWIGFLVIDWILRASGWRWTSRGGADISVLAASILVVLTVIGYAVQLLYAGSGYRDDMKVALSDATPTRFGFSCSVV